MKNPTPRQIATYAAVALAALLLVFLIIGKLAMPGMSWILVPVLPIITGVAAYFIILYLLEQFIYRKVKLIYKTISDRKRTETTLKDLDLNEHILEAVQEEVRHWAEDKTREIEKLKDTEKYRREFIGNVSHELKTPIFNIQGYIHTLIDGGLKDDKINLDYLHKAANNINRLSNIVEDLEAISLLESGQLTMDFRPFDIFKLTQEVFESLEMQADSADITLGFKKGCDKSTIVIGDRDRIRQVLVNLISNSIKYGRENGRTLVGFYDMDQNILTEVSDNGIGIDKEHLDRLFERFYRVDKSRSRHQGGTGLGLAIVKHIIEAHKQTITVRSTIGEGSTFGFTLQKGK